jgi:hypothetical protein
MVSNTANTVLLLSASGASGSLGATITSTAGTFAIVPTFSSPPPPSPPPSTQAPSWFLPVMFGSRALFTDNNRFYYKPNSLSSGGIGGVRNHRKKGRRTYDIDFILLRYRYATRHMIRLVNSAISQH